MSMNEVLKQVAIPLAVSLCMGVFGVLWNAGTQKTLLEQNIEATSELSKAVLALRITVAETGAKYLTREEFDRRFSYVERK